MPTQEMFSSIIPLVAIFAIFWFMIIRPQRKRDKETKEMLAALKVGDKVVTIGGILGTINAIKDDSITVEVGADKTRIKLERWAVKGLQQ